jgi:hypothetical protein
MQRFAVLALALGPRLLAGQEAAGTQLWRLAGATVPTPPALAAGGTAGWWTPAQPERASIVALELVQTPATVGAAGFVASLRAGLGRTHVVGVAYGRMAVSDLVRTTLSPDPNGAAIPYYTQAARALWSFGAAGTTFGAALAYHQTRLDDARGERVTLDIAARRDFGGRLTLAATTHFLGAVASDAAQDVFAAAQLRLWRGELWTGSGQAVVHARYGIAFGHEFAADHQLAAGLEVGNAFNADVMLVREGGYGVASWRPVAGLQLRVGRYRVLFSGDAGPRRLGAAYRVGLEARWRS